MGVTVVCLQMIRGQKVSKGVYVRQGLKEYFIIWTALNEPYTYFPHFAQEINFAANFPIQVTESCWKGLMSRCGLTCN